MSRGYKALLAFTDGLHKLRDLTARLLQALPAALGALAPQAAQASQAVQVGFLSKPIRGCSCIAHQVDPLSTLTT